MNCPACISQRWHTEAEWLNHPMRGHGFTREQGWTHPDAQKAHDAEMAEVERKLNERRK
jgi:hypothetical protein